MADCLFCKIVQCEIPNYTVYQDENVLAFLDIHPCTKGHTVVVPRRHAATIAEMSQEAWQDLMIGLKKTIQVIEKVLEPAGLNVGINDRPVAGQAVSHMHWHIIPRYPDDGGGSMHSIIRAKMLTPVAAVAALFK